MRSEKERVNEKETVKGQKSMKMEVGNVRKSVRRKRGMEEDRVREKERGAVKTIGHSEK